MFLVFLQKTDIEMRLSRERGFNHVNRRKTILNGNFFAIYLLLFFFLYITINLTFQSPAYLSIHKTSFPSIKLSYRLQTYASLLKADISVCRHYRVKRDKYTYKVTYVYLHQVDTADLSDSAVHSIYPMCSLIVK